MTTENKMLQQFAKVVARLADNPACFAALRTMMPELEQVFIVQDRDYDGFLDLWLTAKSESTTDFGQVTCALGVFNGRRRMQDQDAAALLREGKEVLDAIQALTDDSRKDELLALRHYNMGILLRDSANGPDDFRRAAEFQRQSADAYEKLGNTASAAISRFLMAVETANAALFEGNGITEALTNLSEEAPLAAVDLTPHPWAINIHLHTLLAYAWADRLAEVPDSVFNAAMGSGKPAWVRLAKAMDAFRKNDDRAFVAAAEEVIANAGTDKHADISETGHLLLARWLVKHDQNGLAKQNLLQNTNWSGLKGRVVKAVATRELAALTG